MNAFVHMGPACPVYPQKTGPKMRYHTLKFSGNECRKVSADVMAIVLGEDVRRFASRWGQFPLIQIDADRVAVAACGVAVVAIRDANCKAKPNLDHNTFVWLSMLGYLDRKLELGEDAECSCAACEGREVLE
ncbi:hypothetical protein [Paracoccus yeei]|uniref:hypothetical protein n=1 Tax=Paracoccus yeei TaxID=147645 RepID=UPI00174E62FC|nr:hypothetical protein [Paracoccus yeei]